MDNDICLIITFFYFLLVPLASLPIALITPIKKKWFIWLCGLFWPVTLPIVAIVGYICYITDEISGIIKSR